MEATIKLTKTMLDKSIIDANKTVQQFIVDDFEMTSLFKQKLLDDFI